MSPSSVVHGGLYDTKYVTLEQILRAAFVADKTWVVYLEPSSYQVTIGFQNHVMRFAKKFAVSGFFY